MLSKVISVLMLTLLLLQCFLGIQLKHSHGHSGDVLRCSWANITPAIDGSIDIGEWDDANIHLLTFFTSELALNIEAYVYAKNNAGNAYILIDVVGDRYDEQSAARSLDLDFDVGNDATLAEWQDFLISSYSTLSGDEAGLLVYNGDYFEYIGWNGLFNSSFEGSPNDPHSHWIYEFAIPLEYEGVQLEIENGFALTYVRREDDHFHVWPEDSLIDLTKWADFFLAELNVLTCSWAETIPTIDGIFGQNEWDDANAYHTCFYDYYYGAGACETFFYLKNSEDHFYFLMDIVGDLSELGPRYFELLFDCNHDGELTEFNDIVVGVIVFEDGGGAMGFFDPSGGSAFNIVGLGVEVASSPNSESPHWIFEMDMPTGHDGIRNPELSIVGFKIALGWPDSPDWGDIIFAHKTTPPSLEIASLGCPSQVIVNQDFQLDVNIEYSLSSSTDIRIRVYEHAGPLLDWTEDTLSGAGSETYPFTLTAPSTPKPDWQLNVHLDYWDGDEWIQSEIESAHTEVKETPGPSYPSDKWERIWYVNEGNGVWGDFLGLGPNQDQLNFNDDWGAGAVAYGRQDYVGFVSSRTIYIEGGTWKFTVITDDGVRIYIDDELVLDKWFNQYETYSFQRTFASANPHQFRLEWYEQASTAHLSFNMEQTSAELAIQFYPDEHVLKHDKVETTVTIEIENTGNADARNVIFDIRIPDYFETDHNTHFEWATLPPGNRETVEIDVRAKRCKNGDIRLEGSYKDVDDSIIDVHEHFRILVREFIVTEYNPKYVKFSLSAEYTRQIKDNGWYALQFASELWVIIMKMDLGLPEPDFLTLLDCAEDLYNILETLWDAGTLPVDVAWKIYDMYVGLGLNAFGLLTDCCIVDKVNDDGTLDYHSIWPLRAATGLGWDVVGIVLNAIEDELETHPMSDDFFYFVDKEGKLDIEVFADGKEVTVIWVENKALAIIEAGTRQISYVINAKQAEKAKEEYDFGLLMIQEDELVDQILITESIEKDEVQEFQVQVGAGNIELINRVFNIPWESRIYKVGISTVDSVVLNIHFNQPEMKITFKVDGEDEMLGYCNLTIPTIVLGGPYTIRKDGFVLAHSEWSNGTHSFLSFSYSHSIRNIEIKGTTAIPEFSSILPLFMIATLLTVIVHRRKYAM